MTNRYGVDVRYFNKELSALSQSLDDRTPEELQRYLLRLADVAMPNQHTIFEKKYEGFESLNDVEQDVCECFDPSFNEKAKVVPPEFQGTVKITIVYVEPKKM